MGAEPRLRIMRLLLTAHPQGLVVGEIQSELGIPPSTLSHHLDKLKSESLVRVRREGNFLWHTANTDSLQELISFLYAECCTRNRVIEPGELVTVGRTPTETRKGKKHERGKSETGSEREIRAGSKTGDSRTAFMLRPQGGESRPDYH